MFIVQEGSETLSGTDGLIAENTSAEISFTVPPVGHYRLMVFVYDDTNRKKASAVIPFAVDRIGTGTSSEDWSAGNLNW